MLGARVIAVAVGYCFGLFQTGYIYGEKHGVDIRTQGSGNAGTTNTLRVLGWKAGLITFLGDLFCGASDPFHFYRKISGCGQDLRTLRRVRSSFGTQLPILSEI